MITKEKEVQLNPELLRLLQDRININELFIVDIETTGFSSELNKIYLIGCLHFSRDHFKFIQWLCEKNEDEYELLFRFSQYIKNFKVALHYNGTTFDFPFIKKRFERYHISSRILDIKEIDLYTELRPLHRFFNLDNLKLKTVEAYFGYERTDRFDGKALINTFLDYIKSPDAQLESTLLLHNEEDLLGLYQSLNAYKSIQLFEAMRLKSIDTNDLSLQVDDLTLQLSLPYAARFNTVIKRDPYFLQVQEDRLILSTSIIETTLNYYLTNYKDYFYLPQEDEAIHKSIAKFVHKDHKTKATKENCYIKKRGKFLPLLHNVSSVPVFKSHCKDLYQYVELTDQLLSSRAFLSQFFLDTLSTL